MPFARGSGARKSPRRQSGMPRLGGGGGEIEKGPLTKDPPVLSMTLFTGKTGGRLGLSS